MIGTTAAASSDVEPMTSTSLEVVANSLLTAGTASAGSPLVSTDVQVILWPSTPPALLMACVAPSQETRYVGPSAASTPLKGATSATTSGALDPAPELLLQAVTALTSAAAVSTAQARVYPCDVRHPPRVLPGRPAFGTADPWDVNIAIPSVDVFGGSRVAGSEPASAQAPWPPPPVAAVAVLGHHAIADGPDALDGDLDNVTGL